MISSQPSKIEEICMGTNTISQQHKRNILLLKLQQLLFVYFQIRILLKGLKREII